ncbi:MAG: YlxR family protein [Candidatus Cloacimonetes bacterium]|nr:YlxR family protein [Candidatus Cloacimonadota bacterium]
MPNMNSNAGHKPIRTCVVCRQKSTKEGLLPFILLSGGIVYDLGARLQCRKYYHCPGCLPDLPKWRKRKSKHKGKTA